MNCRSMNPVWRRWWRLLWRMENRKQHIGPWGRVIGHDFPRCFFGMNICNNNYFDVNYRVPGLWRITIWSYIGLYYIYTHTIYWYTIWLCMHIVEHLFLKEVAHLRSAHSSVSVPQSPKLMVCKNIWPYLVLHPVLNIMGFCPYFVPSPGMPWQESVLLDRCEERNRGGGHHLRFCEHSHQDTRCRGCRWCRWCQAGRFRRTWNCEIGYIDITSQPELSRPYISLQWCNDARMVLTVEEWAWRMFRSLRPQCRKGWKTVRSQEVIICIYGFLYVCIHYTLDTFQFQVCFSIGKILSVLGG